MMMITMLWTMVITMTFTQTDHDDDVLTFTWYESLHHGKYHHHKDDTDDGNVVDDSDDVAGSTANGRQAGAAIRIPGRDVGRGGDSLR